MTTAVKLKELMSAHEWASGGDGASGDCEAYVNRATGTVYWCGDGMDEEAPDDFDDERLYIAVPDRSELDLGRSLALRFVEERLPGRRDAAGDCFRRRGAYACFKSMLERAGELGAWHRYEEEATEAALRAWCSEHGLTVVCWPPAWPADPMIGSSILITATSSLGAR